MEDILFGAAVAFFIAAAVFAVASVVAFRKLEVADAVRFLRHRTTAQGVGLVGVLAHKPKERKAKAEDLERDTAPSIARKKGKHERATASKDAATATVAGEIGDGATPKRRASANKKGSVDVAGKSADEGRAVDNATGAMPEATDASMSSAPAAADSATTILAGFDDAHDNARAGDAVQTEGIADTEGVEASESPTTLLADFDVSTSAEIAESERPTSLLACEESENPTELLSLGDDSEQTGLAVGSSDSENPTEMLATDGDSENPTEVLWLDEDVEDVAFASDASPVPDSENPTELLAPIESLPQEDSPRQTMCLEPLAVASCQEDDDTGDVGTSARDESTFWFRMKQSQMSIHTDEVIGQ